MPAGRATERDAAAPVKTPGEPRPRRPRPSQESPPLCACNPPPRHSSQRSAGRRAPRLRDSDPRSRERGGWGHAGALGPGFPPSPGTRSG